MMSSTHHLGSRSLALFPSTMPSIVPGITVFVSLSSSILQINVPKQLPLPSGADTNYRAVSLVLILDSGQLVHPADFQDSPVM